MVLVRELAETATSAPEAASRESALAAAEAYRVYKEPTQEKERDFCMVLVSDQSESQRFSKETRRMCEAGCREKVHLIFLFTNSCVLLRGNPLFSGAGTFTLYKTPTEKPEDL